MDDAISQFLLDLYRASREYPHPGFKDWIFERLQSVVAFDSAWWGSGSERPLRVHRVHLFQCDPRILDDYPQYIEQDYFREAVSRSPGRVIMSSDLLDRASFEATDMYRKFGRPYKVEWPMGVVLTEPVSSLNEFLTIWRHDPRKPFSEVDRRSLQAVVPHLSEAHRVCRVNRLRDPAGSRRAAPWALCAADGVLQDVSPSFIDLVRQEWPDWRDAELPPSMGTGIARDRHFTGKRIVIDAREAGDLLLLEGRWRSALDTLSPREMEVARRYAKGETYVAIATELGVAPSTVRNQLYRAFRKLHVNNKTELLLRLFEISAGGDGGNPKMMGGRRLG